MQFINKVVNLLPTSPGKTVLEMFKLSFKADRVFDSEVSGSFLFMFEKGLGFTSFSTSKPF